MNGAGTQGYTFQKFVEGLVIGLFDNKPKTEITKELGICRKTLWDWEQKVDWEVVAQARRKTYKQQVLAVDQAMLREAAKGNVAAANLVYQRFDGWTPEQVLKLEARVDGELLERHKQLAERLRALEYPAGNEGHRTDLSQEGAARETEVLQTERGPAEIPR